MNQPLQAIIAQSQPTVSSSVGTNQQTFSVPSLFKQYMSNSDNEQALSNTGRGTYHRLGNPSVTSNQQIPNLDSKQSIFNGGTTDSHSLPGSSFTSAGTQSNQSSVSNAGRFIQFG